MKKPEALSLNNRELSWLEFNQRVLDEADDASVPLLERLFFLSVVSSNLDEFFMVRVGGLMLQCAAGVTRPDPSGMRPAELLAQLRKRVRTQVKDQYGSLRNKVLAELAARQITVSAGARLTAEEMRALEPDFETQIFPVVTPVGLGETSPFPVLPSLALYLAVRLSPAKDETAPRHVLIKLGPGLARLWRIPSSQVTRRFALLEDIVRAFLPKLLPGQELLESTVFRVSRNADMAVEEEETADLAVAMRRVLRERRTGPSIVRLEVEDSASDEMVQWLASELNAIDETVIRIHGPIDLTGLRELRGMVDDADLVYPAWTSQPHPALDPAAGIFEQMAQQDFFIATPYESFDPVLKLVETAAADPQVRAIKMVLYRTSTKGPLVRALAAAAQSGKHVTVLIELKARFDEERNIDWAHGLEESGVQVIYGVRRLKTHAKICLVIRREDDGIRHYMHFGTGNYNETTAKFYTDVGLFTCDPILGRDATVFFHAVSGFSEPQTYQKLVQAPTGMRDRLLELIRFETAQAESHQPAQIAAKMNALVDPALIAALYEASQAGVEIRLCVRGICCLRPGVKGLSENISVISVVDRFLEHSRIFHFLHGGEDECFLSSADWMPRNLDSRIELLVPVQDAICRRRLLELLHTSLSDNVKAWKLLPGGTYKRVTRPHGQRPIRSQETLCELARETIKQVRRAQRTVFDPHLPRGKE
jgi:polyphosphate kinase